MNLELSSDSKSKRKVTMKLVFFPLAPMVSSKTFDIHSYLLTHQNPKYHQNKYRLQLTTCDLLASKTQPNLNVITKLIIHLLQTKYLHQAFQRYLLWR